MSVWGRQGEATNQYLTKGRMVLVEGHLRPDPQTGGPRVYTRQDGTAGSSFEVTAETVRFLGGREDGGGSANFNNASGAPAGGKPAAHEEDDIPF